MWHSVEALWCSLFLSQSLFSSFQTAFEYFMVNERNLCWTYDEEMTSHPLNRYLESEDIFVSHHSGSWAINHIYCRRNPFIFQYETILKNTWNLNIYIYIYIYTQIYMWYGLSFQTYKVSIKFPIRRAKKSNNECKKNKTKSISVVFQVCNENTLILLQLNTTIARSKK